MLRLFSQPRRKAHPVRLRRARLTVEFLESRSGPSALYDPLVVEPLDTTTALWSTSDAVSATTDSGDDSYATDPGGTGFGTEAEPIIVPTTGAGSEPAPGDSPLLLLNGDGGGGGGGDPGQVDPLLDAGQQSPNESQNKPPVIEDFCASEGPGRCWHFTGRVVDENPGGLVVTLGGDLPSLRGKTVITDPNGNFSLYVILEPGEGGIVTAVTVDPQGLSSNVAQDYVHQTD